MADFGTPIAQNVNPMGGLDTISKLLAIKGQRQAIAGQAAEVQATQQTTRQRANIANIDWSKYDGGDGTISLDKFAGDTSVRKAAGDAYPDLLDKVTAIKGKQVLNKQAIANLNDTNRVQFGTMVGALADDEDVKNDTDAGRAKVAETIDAFGKLSPETAAIAKIFAPVATAAPKGKLGRGVRAIQLMAQDASAQQAQQNPVPGAVSTGNVVQPIVTPKATGIPQRVGVPFQMGIPPSYITGPSNQVMAMPGLAPGQAQGQVIATTPPPASGPPQNVTGPKNDGSIPVPGPNAPKWEIEAYQAQTELGIKNQWTTRTAALAAPSQIDALHKIRDLADKAQTGPGSQSWADIKAAVGGFTGIKAASNAATSTNELAKLMAQTASQQAAALGASTDQKNSQIASGLPHATQDPEALKYSANYAAAIQQAFIAKANAQQKWLETHGQNSATIGQFEDKFRQALNPHVFQAQEMSDAEAAKFIKSLPAAEQQKFKTSVRQLKELGAID